MFFDPNFLIPASLIVFAEAALIIACFYALKGKIKVPVDGPAAFLWKLEYEQKVARILFPLAVVLSLIVDGSALHAYVKHSNEKFADAELTEALKPVLSKAVSIKRDAVCTHNGFIAGSDTLERDKIACAQVGDFRVLNPGTDRSSVYIFKARSATEVVQVVRFGYAAISIIDGETTVDQLKTAFDVK